MNTEKKMLIVLTVTGILTGNNLAALADTSKGKPFEGVVVEDVVVIEQLPTEVQTGSVKIRDENASAMTNQAKINSSEAAKIAATALPGKVIEIKLDDENSYLIWEVKVIGLKGQAARLKIDAGDGRLLATGSDNAENWEDKDKGTHSRWKFRENNDKGKHRDVTL